MMSRRLINPRLFVAFALLGSVPIAAVITPANACAQEFPSHEGVDSNPPPLARADPRTYAGWNLEQWQRLVLNDFDPDTRTKGMLALGRLGHFGKQGQTIATFKAVLSQEPDPVVRSAAYVAVATFGEDAFPILEAGLKSDVTDERQIALYALADFFAPLDPDVFGGSPLPLPTSTTLVPDSRLPELITEPLTEIFADTRADRYDRRTAGRALQSLFERHPRPTSAPGVVAAAQQVTDVGDLDLACQAIGLIGALGSAAKPVVPDLAKLAQRQERPRPADSAGAIRARDAPLISRPIAAVNALGALGATASTAIPVLERLQDQPFGSEVYVSGLARRAIQAIRNDLENAEQAEGKPGE